ncbi:alpha/beta hydrolase [Duncaniella muris]|uniref:alpha/beta hydrolase n=2 Tax=Pseudomonadati TaxID=3379134 RepID=UPI00350EFF42
MNRIIILAAFFIFVILYQTLKNMDNKNINTSVAPVEQLVLTQEWDKVFPKSDKTDHRKVTFVNRYGITLAADMYIPKDTEGKLAAITVSGPFGAVKEQSSGLYAQQLAERGFLTIAFDPSFTGESGGEPRRVASPDINVEDFSAAVDFLSTCTEVDPERIGILGICGWGGIAIQAAINDPRIKATVASTMYDMTRVTANGYFDADNSKEKRNATRAALAAQRTEDYRNGYYRRAGGVVDPLPEDVPQFVKDYHAYYKTPRGYHERSGNSTDGWNSTSVLPFMNFRFFEYAGELDNAVMIVHGENAHSRYFGEDTFKLLRGDNKELLIVADASHCDLYDNLEKIPMNQIATFFNTHMPQKD